jgi:hypothetical protein
LPHQEIRDRVGIPNKRESCQERVPRNQGTGSQLAKARCGVQGRQAPDKKLGVSRLHASSVRSNLLRRRFLPPQEAGPSGTALNRGRAGSGASGWLSGPGTSRWKAAESVLRPGADPGSAPPRGTARRCFGGESRDANQVLPAWKQVARRGPARPTREQRTARRGGRRNQEEGLSSLPSPDDVAPTSDRTKLDRASGWPSGCPNAAMESGVPWTGRCRREPETGRPRKRAPRKRAASRQGSDRRWSEK